MFSGLLSSDFTADAGKVSGPGGLNSRGSDAAWIACTSLSRADTSSASPSFARLIVTSMGCLGSRGGATLRREVAQQSHSSYVAQDNLCDRGPATAVFPAA